MFWQEDNCPISPFLWRKLSMQIIQHLLNCDCCFNCHSLVAALILLNSDIPHHEFYVLVDFFENYFCFNANDEKQREVLGCVNNFYLVLPAFRHSNNNNDFFTNMSPQQM